MFPKRNKVVAFANRQKHIPPTINDNNELVISWSLPELWTYILSIPKGP